MIDVFVSKPTESWEKFKRGMDNFLNYLRDRKINPRTIGSTDYPAKGPMDEVIGLMEQCRGAIILGIPQIVIGVGMGPDGKEIRDLRLASEWNHIEAALAYARGLPTLVIHDAGVKRGIFAKGTVNNFIYEIDMSKHDWNMTSEIRGAINTWLKRVEEFKPLEIQIKSTKESPHRELVVDDHQKNILLIFHKLDLEPLSDEAIAKGLSITVTEARYAIDQLIEMGLVTHWSARTYAVTKEGRAFLVKKILSSR